MERSHAYIRKKREWHQRQDQRTEERALLATMSGEKIVEFFEARKREAIKQKTNFLRNVRRQEQRVSEELSGVN